MRKLLTACAGLTLGLLLATCSVGSAQQSIEPPIPDARAMPPVAVAPQYVPAETYRTSSLSVSNYYNGTGSLYELQNGIPTGLDNMGRPIKVSLLPDGNRRMIALSRDSEQNIVARTFPLRPLTSFSRQVMEVPAGTTVTFFSKEGHHLLEGFDVGNQLTRLPMMPDPVAVDTNQIYSYTFNEPGEYRFIDNSGMYIDNQQPLGFEIMVTGDRVGDNGQMPPTAYVTPPAVAIFYPVPPYWQEKTVVQEQTKVQVQGEREPAPVKKVPHKKVKQVKRNRDVK